MYSIMLSQKQMTGYKQLLLNMKQKPTASEEEN